MKHLKKFLEDKNGYMTKIIFLSSFFFTILSCATNNKKNIIDKLYTDNNNVFYITSTYVNRKVVWSYSNDKIIIYSLNSKNKILEKKEELLVQQRNFFTLDLNDNYEMDGCMELDGDILGYRIKQNGITQSNDFPVNSKCIVNKMYTSAFFSKLKYDIIKYNLILYK